MRPCPVSAWQVLCPHELAPTPHPSPLTPHSIRTTSPHHRHLPPTLLWGASGHPSPHGSVHSRTQSPPAPTKSRLFSEHWLLQSILVQPGFFLSFFHCHVPGSEIRIWLTVWGGGYIAFSLWGQEALEKWRVSREDQQGGGGGDVPGGGSPGVGETGRMAAGVAGVRHKGPGHKSRREAEIAG